MVKIDIMWLNMWSYGGNLEFWKLLIGLVGEKETTCMGETFFFFFQIYLKFIIFKLVILHV